MKYFLKGRRRISSDSVLARLFLYQILFLLSGILAMTAIAWVVIDSSTKSKRSDQREQVITFFADRHEELRVQAMLGLTEAMERELKNLSQELPVEDLKVIKAEDWGAAMKSAGYLAFPQTVDPQLPFFVVARPSHHRLMGIGQPSTWIFAATAMGVLIYFFVAWISINYILRRIYRPMWNLLEHLADPKDEAFDEFLKREKPEGEVFRFATEIKRLLDREVELAKIARNNVNNANLAKLAAQVAHDIRSPLVALKSVLKMRDTDLAKNNNILVAAASRIESIADDLLSKFKGSGSSSSISGPCFPLAVVESIVAEKRVVLGHSSIISINLQFNPEAAFTQVAMDRHMYGRIVSNLLNNAMESIPHCEPGRVWVELRRLGTLLQFAIKDNGQGIPAAVLKALRAGEAMTTKRKGNGIGLSQTMKSVEEKGGRLEIDSHPGQGTTVTVSLPSFEMPEWCATGIDLKKKRHVLVIDDDQSVRSVWERKLAGAKVTFFSDPQQIDMKSFPIAETFFIVDQELNSSWGTGLDFIRAHQLARHSILSTSYYDDKDLQSAIVSCGSQILPKFLIDVVPIEFARVERENQESEMNSIDAVLIDDDELIHTVWRLAAERLGKRVVTVKFFEELAWHEVSEETPIYVDKNLQGATDGFEVARRIHGLGFENVFLATGEPLSRQDLPPFIKGCIGKEFPFASKRN